INFTGATAVTFGPTPAAGFTFVSDTQLNAISPAETVSTVDLIVTTPSGTSSISISDQFTFTGMTSYFQWFDLASAGMVNDNVHLLNPGNASATVTVSVPGASPLTATVAAGAETYVSFPQGTIGGPVTISATQPVLASQRVQYYSSFNEVWAQSAAQAATTSYVNWYDKASAGMNNDNIH